MESEYVNTNAVVRFDNLSKYRIKFDLIWKTEPPTESGLYWAIRKEEAYPEPEPVRITMMTWKSNKHYCWSTKADNLESVEAFTHWLGPLPTPELPKPIAQK